MQINGETEIYGIMGRPVSHSLSPPMHNAAFQALGLNKIYIPFKVHDVARALDGFRAVGVRGVSVTIPYKQTVMSCLDSIDPLAERIGAVNTLVLDGSHIRGYNTDWMGAVRALHAVARLPGSTVLVLGAGGAARAVGFGLKEKGSHVIVANRTRDRGEKLARDLDCRCAPLSEIRNLRIDALVNATSVGMAPEVEATPVPHTFLKGIPAVMDIVYSPLRTRLLREAEEAGCRTVNGLSMLLYQGAAQFELWTGREAPIDMMQKILFSRLHVKNERNDWRRKK